MSDLKRITLFADDPDDERSLDYLWVEAWLERWKGQVRVVDYSTGGWEHIWNLEAPAEAVAEIPEHLFCGSAWANPELGDCNPAKAAVEIAQAIIGRRTDLIEGCAGLASLAYALVPDWSADEDFVVFGALASETDHLPTAPVRQHWSPAALAEADAQIARIEREARADVERACNNVIARFSP